MGKKKGKKKRPQQSQPRVAGKSSTGGAEAMKALADIFTSTKASPIAKMTAPPENVIEHLTRVGAPFWVAQVGVDEEGSIVCEPCLIVPFDELIRAEAEAVQPGSGDAKVQQAKRLLISESAKRQIEAVAKIQSPFDQPKEQRARPDYGPPFPDPAANAPEEDDDEWDLPHIQG